MIEFALPSLGADMDEGTLLEWLVKPGDEVQRGQVVAVVDTAKAAIDVECWETGTVDTLVVSTGAKIPVGSVLALLRAPGETEQQARAWKAAHPVVEAAGVTAAPQSVAAAPSSPGHAAPSPQPAAVRRRISPAARRRAQQLGIDIATLSGSGPEAAINVEDIERAAAAQSTPEPAGRGASMRRTIAAAMARSKREIPHYYLTARVPLERASSWLQEQNAARPVTSRVLMAALFVAAAARTLARFPAFNGFFRDGRYQPSSAIHIGLAISLREGGLIAPALLNADAKSLQQLMQELTDLVRRARSYTLKSSELASATITLTNLGDGGAETVLGIIYPPQVALIGFGSVIQGAYAEGDRLRAAPMATVSLCADHRVSDGHQGARLLAALGSALQQPEKL